MSRSDGDVDSVFHLSVCTTSCSWHDHLYVERVHFVTREVFCKDHEAQEANVQFCNRIARHGQEERYEEG